MLKQIINGRILTPQGWLEGGSIIVEGNKIKAVANTDLPIEGAEVLDAKGCHVVPGGIEMHVHGGGGRDFMEGTEEAFRVAVQAHLEYGTTSIFPTLSSSTVPMIEQAMETCDKLMSEPDSPILGLHLEGPYFNPKQAGAQIPEWIKAPVAEEYEPLLKKSKCLKRWDEAPELPGSIEFIKCCCQHGVLPSIGHTRAKYDEVHAANEAGMTHATHFYNAMPVVYKNREFKETGTVESIFAEENMTVEMIADGIHVPPVMLRMIYQIKGVERTALVTDSLACAATHGDAAFDPRVILEDGVCKLADRSALAGSIATMDRLIRTCVQQAGIPLEDACRMASETPAKIMKVYDRKGSLEAGKDADIIMLDPNLELTYVMQMGHEVVNKLA
ncbi:MAG: N-acetylglucosamine-6-phosphate deacetylase [Bacteroidales bacterium]|nr:N-acetylglucosamine-6-phosphate deacetylase [Bacteroidales bacterium]